MTSDDIQMKKDMKKSDFQKKKCVAASKWRKIARENMYGLVEVSGWERCERARMQNQTKFENNIEN